MKKSTILLLILSLIPISSISLFAQQNSTSWSSGIPAPVNQVSVANASGTPAATTQCFYIVAIYPIGESTPAGPQCIFNATQSGTIVIAWTGLSAATGYHVLQATTQTNPLSAGSCASCRISTNQAGTSFTWNLAAGGAYTPSQALPAISNVVLDNLSFTQPRMRADTLWQFVAGTQFSDGTIQTSANISPSQLSSITDDMPWVCKPASASGTAYSCTPTLLDGTAIPAAQLASPVAGQLLILIPDVNSTGTAATLTIDGTTAKAIKKGMTSNSGGDLNSTSDLVNFRSYLMSLTGAGSLNQWFLQGIGKYSSSGGTVTITQNANTYNFEVAGNALSTSIVAPTSAIVNAEAQVVGLSIPANTLLAGSSFHIHAGGNVTTGAAPGNDTFRVRIGPTTLTGTIPASVAAAANATVTGQPFVLDATITIRTNGAGGTVIGDILVDNGGSLVTGAFTLSGNIGVPTATVAVDSTVVNILELTFVSGAATSSATFQVAEINLVKL